jgi:hypothetical protein
LEATPQIAAYSSTWRTKIPILPKLQEFLDRLTIVRAKLAKLGIKPMLEREQIIWLAPILLTTIKVS